MKSKILTVVALLASLFAASLSADDSTAIDSTETKDLLVARNQEFRQEVIRVSERVYTAVGFGMSPVSMIIGDSGLVIIDTNSDLASGQKVLAEFRKITNKKVKAIVLTHSHADHTGGARAFVQHDTEIWARDPFNTEEMRFKQAGLSIFQQRGFRQFGILAPEEDINHVGIAARYFPQVLDNTAGQAEPIKPTHTFRDTHVTLKKGGLELELVAADGETSDQMFVWFEQDRVVFSGDNFYKSWPNLYAIRGTAYRDVAAWIDSLTTMLGKNPHHLVGGHTRPILGEPQTTEVLTNYRDAVKHIFDKTIEGINKGLTPNELVEYATLPDKYLNLDYLRPYYGHPDWAVRSIFNGYLGWFDGNPTTLFPLSDAEEASRMVELAGGKKALLRAVEKALAGGQHQWALQLTDHLLKLSPTDESLLLSKADILDTLAQQRLNVTARNYYRSYAFELRSKVDRQRESTRPGSRDLQPQQ